MPPSALLTPRPPRHPSTGSAVPQTPTAGPSSGAATPTRQVSSGPADSVDLWEDILRSADRQKSHAHKNVILLAERHRGRTHLLDKLAGKRRQRIESPALAIGYQVLESDDRDEDAAPPLSVFYPPSSHPALLKLVDTALPPNPLPDTAVVIVLDWTKPSSMVRELLTWLSWVDAWAGRIGKDTDELRERLQAHLQHYTEPPAAGSAPPAAKALGTTLLPLGPGTLTLNPHGVPIIVVCTRADQMDSVGDEMGMKGGSWEERTDWIQQVLRTICLSYGAALFYTSQTQPNTYKLLRDYLHHRLYTTSSGSEAPSSRFPFPHRANVLDRDAVLVPSGWDSWGKINVLREGFDLQRVHSAWEASVNGTTDTDDEAIDDLWTAMVPDTERPKPPNAGAVTTTSEGEQAFLSRQLETLLKDPHRDPRASFRHAVNSASAQSAEPEPTARYAGGVVGPMGAGGLNLPGVEKAMAEMEGGDDVKERFARIARRQDPSKPQSPPNDRPAVPNEALHNFFQGLLAKKSGGTPTQTPTKSK